MTIALISRFHCQVNCQKSGSLLLLYPAHGALSDDAVWRLSVWRLSRLSGWWEACAAGRLAHNGWSGSAGLARGCTPGWGHITVAAHLQIVLFLLCCLFLCCHLCGWIKGVILLDWWCDKSGNSQVQSPNSRVQLK